MVAAPAGQAGGLLFARCRGSGGRVAWCSALGAALILHATFVVLGLPLSVVLAVSLCSAVVRAHECPVLPGMLLGSIPQIQSTYGAHARGRLCVARGPRPNLHARLVLRATRCQLRPTPLSNAALLCACQNAAAFAPHGALLA